MSNTEKKSLSFPKTQRPLEILNRNFKLNDNTGPAESQQLTAELQVKSINDITSIEWEDPVLLESAGIAKPAPTNSMPTIFSDAIHEVTEYTKAPIAIPAASALSAGSLAAQGLINVRRDERLVSPVSVFLLTIAESGERKTTCDNFFTSEIINLERQNFLLNRDKLQEYKAQIDIWETKYRAIQNKIKQAASGGKDKLDKLEALLISVSKEKPKGCFVPKYILGDETIENLTWTLSKNWPSSGIISSEGSIIFGSKSMSRDAQSYSLGIFNRIWDGGQLDFGRKTSESYTMPTARLTLGIQTQPAAFKEFNNKPGHLARGTGLLARCLISAPKSTQGKRFYTSPPTEWPALSRFNGKVGELLKLPLNIEDGILKPAIIPLSEKAKNYWIDFQDNIEAELSKKGKYHRIRDIASKASENAARIAGIFHVFTSDIFSEISLENLIFGSEIAQWYLDEANRFFKTAALSEVEKNAYNTSNWLVNKCRLYGTDYILRSELIKKGPDGIRNKNDLNKALELLNNLNHAMQVKIDGVYHIIINPKLLKE